MLNMKARFKKIIPATLAFAALLTVAPLSSFAAENDIANVPTEKVQQNVVNFPQTNYNVNSINPDDDGVVEGQGWKKSVMVFALKHGGPALEDLLGYLGKTAYKNEVKENRLLLANFLDSIDYVAKKELKSFLVDVCDITPSTAEVIADAILFFIF